jgi:hypothetical protein
MRSDTHAGGPAVVPAPAPAIRQGTQRFLQHFEIHNDGQKTEFTGQDKAGRCCNTGDHIKLATTYHDPCSGRQLTLSRLLLTRLPLSRAR